MSQNDLVLSHSALKRPVLERKVEMDYGREWIKGRWQWNVEIEFYEEIALR